MTNNLSDKWSILFHKIIVTPNLMIDLSMYVMMDGPLLSDYFTALFCAVVHEEFQLNLDQ